MLAAKRCREKGIQEECLLLESGDPYADRAFQEYCDSVFDETSHQEMTGFLETLASRFSQETQTATRKLTLPSDQQLEFAEQALNRLFER
jgi:hypothetical protein